MHKRNLSDALLRATIDRYRQAGGRVVIPDHSALLRRERMAERLDRNQRHTIVVRDCPDAPGYLARPAECAKGTGETWFLRLRNAVKWAEARRRYVVYRGRYMGRWRAA